MRLSVLTIENAKPTFSSYFDLKIVLEKLRFRHGLVWTLGLTGEIKLRFPIIEIIYGTVVLCYMKQSREVSANIHERR